MNKVILKKFRPTMDWYAIDDVVIDVDDFHSFEIESRGGHGDWYLKHYAVKDKNVFHDWRKDFNLDQPSKAVELLGSKIVGFTCNYSNGAKFMDELKRLLDK